MTQTGDPARRLTTANMISIGRILLVPVFALLLLRGRDVAAFTVYVVAGLSDLLDGWLARHHGQATHLGAVLDPLADKLLVATAYVLLGLGATGVGVPLWLTALVLARDLLIGLVVVSAAFSGRREFPPSRLGKWTTAVQVGCVVWVLVVRAFGLPATGLPVGFLVVAGFTIASGSAYSLAISREWQRQG